MAVAASGVTDTAGLGGSLLDTILQARTAVGSTLPCFTRLFIALKLADKSYGPGVLAEVSAPLESTADITGLAVLQQTSVWAVVEASPEHSVEFMRRLRHDFLRSSIEEPRRVLQARVVAHVEDCPSRAFGFFSSRTAVGSNPAPNPEKDNCVAVASSLYKAVVEMGHFMLAKAAGGDPRKQLDGLQDTFKSQLPSDEKVSVLAQWERLPSIAEWLSIYDGPVEWEASADLVYPVMPL